MMHGIQPPQGPRFGYRPDALLKVFDFVSIGNSTIPQNKLNYAVCISSRVKEARTGNEKMEVLRRDPFGWFFWFYGNALMQTALMLYLVKGAAQKLLLSKTPQPGSGFGKVMWSLDPTQRFRIASDHQIQQRLAQITKAMQDKGHQHKIPGVRKLFQKARNTRALSSFTGLMFTFLALGIGINLYNIYATWKNVQKSKTVPPAMPHYARFSGQSQPARAPQWHPPMAMR